MNGRLFAELSQLFYEFTFELSMSIWWKWHLGRKCPLFDHIENKALRVQRFAVLSWSYGFGWFGKESANPVSIDMPFPLFSETEVWISLTLSLSFQRFCRFIFWWNVLTWSLQAGCRMRQTASRSLLSLPPLNRVKVFGGPGLYSGTLMARNMHKKCRLWGHLAVSVLQCPELKVCKCQTSRCLQCSLLFPAVLNVLMAGIERLRCQTSQDLPHAFDGWWYS